MLLCVCVCVSYNVRRSTCLLYGDCMCFRWRAHGLLFHCFISINNANNNLQCMWNYCAHQNVYVHISKTYSVSSWTILNIISEIKCHLFRLFLSCSVWNEEGYGFSLCRRLFIWIIARVSCFYDERAHTHTHTHERNPCRSNDVPIVLCLTLNTSCVLQTHDVPIFKHWTQTMWNVFICIVQTFQNKNTKMSPWL